MRRGTAVDQPGCSARSTRVRDTRCLQDTGCPCPTTPEMEVTRPTPPSETVLWVLEAFGLPRAGTTVAEVPAGFSGAIVGRVRLADGTEYAVRGWPPNDLPLERIRGLHRLLAHVHRCGVTTVAVPIQPGELREIDGRPWQVEPWLPGRPDLETDPTPERIAAAAEAIAKWHAAAATFAAEPPDGPWFRTHPSSPSPAVAERLRRLERWRERIGEYRQPLGPGEFDDLAREVLDGFERFAPIVARELRSFGRDRFALQPCLRDVHAGHVLFTGDRVTGLIDASACRSDSVAVDLARCLGDIDGEEEGVWAVGVEAYRRCRAIRSREVDLARMLARSAVVLTGMTWLDRSYSRNTGIDRDPRVLRRMRRIVDRLQRFRD